MDTAQVAGGRAMVSYLDNAQLFGDSTDRLISNNFDIGVLRPFTEFGKSWVVRTIINSHGEPEEKVMVTNTPATLTWQAWKLFDDTVLDALRDRLQAFADIRAAGLNYPIPNAMSHTVLQYQTASKVGRATVSMDPIRRSESDRFVTDIGTVPLPVIHKDFDFSARQIMVSQQGLMPLDPGMAEQSAISVAEEVEVMTVGSEAAFSYGGSAIYGYLNFPNRTLKADMNVPDGTNNAAVLADIVSLRQSLINNRYFGPYMLYVNKQWSQYLDLDFNNAVQGNKTLRQRILDLPDIQDVRTLDFLPQTQFHVVLVEMKTRTVRALVGMEAQTVQWESLGGMMKHYKVMCMLYPQLRPDTDGNSGVAQGHTP